MIDVSTPMSIHQETPVILAELAYQQIKTLPPHHAREVLNYIGYLKARQHSADWEDFMSAKNDTSNGILDSPNEDAWF